MKTKSRLIRKVRFAFGAAVLILIIVGAISYRAIAVSSASDQWVDHTHSVIANLHDLLAALLTVESTCGEDVLSGDEAFLAEYKPGVLHTQAELATLRELTSDNASQQSGLSNLEPIAASKIQLAKKVIAVRRTMGLDDSLKAIGNGGGKKLKDDFRAGVLDMQTEEERLLVPREADANRRLTQTKIVLILGTTLGLVITVIAGSSVEHDSYKLGLAEQAHRESEDTYRRLVQGVQDYAILMLGPLGEIWSWNPGAGRMTGCKFEEVAGQNYSRFFPTEDIKRGRPAEILRMTAEAGIYEDQGMRARGDGTRFMVRSTYTASRDEEGTLRGFTVISCDLTKSSASEAKYQGLLEAAPDAMVVVNQQGEIVFLNIQAEKQFGYRRDELVGQKVKNIIPEGFAERLVADELRSSEDALAQKIGTGIELSGRRKDGTDFPIELMLSLLESAEGILVTAAIRDITTRKTAETYLLQKVEELNRSNEELGQFAYIASHDLQEPLRMVASYTQLLARRYTGKLDADADEFIAFAVDGANRMQQLIQDLLAFSRIGTKGADFVDCSSEEAMQQALVNLRGVIGDSGALVNHDPLPLVLADEMQLVQLFQNLVGNAIKYQNPGVPHVHVSAAMNMDKKWVFSVRDNGLGIDPQYFDKIFGMFQRLHKREEFAGTGIGLAICKKIVERHKGTISVESQLGQGSTFRFTMEGTERKS
jgi:PAS domain S-box-containing protein